MPQYSPFDPEEIRRRQMLGIDPMSDDSDEDEQSLNGSGLAMSPSTLPIQSAPLSPAQQKYKSLIDQAPQPENYQPSKWRKFGAAVAGGLAGLKDAKTGYNVGRTIASQPYEEARAGWQDKVKQSALDVGIDKEAASQDIARRRAGAFEVNSQARMKTAEATEAWRRTQEGNLPWHPKTKDEAFEFEKLKHSPARPGTVEQERQWMKEDPQGFAKYQGLKHAAQKTPEQEQQLIEYRAKMTAKYRRPTQPRVVLPAPPKQQADAEHLAAQQLIREDPKYTHFYINDGKSKPRFLSDSELPSVAKELPGIKGNTGIFSGVTQEQEGLAREMYHQFQSKVKQRAQAILGSRSGGQDDWDIQQEDNEEEDQ